MDLPGSIEELDDELVKGRSVVLLLCDAFVHKGMAAQERFMHKLKHAILTGCMHDLLSTPCISQFSVQRIYWLGQSEPLLHRAFGTCEQHQQHVHGV